MVPTFLPHFQEHLPTWAMSASALCRRAVSRLHTEPRVPARATLGAITKSVFSTATSQPLSFSTWTRGSACAHLSQVRMNPLCLPGPPEDRSAWPCAHHHWVPGEGLHGSLTPGQRVLLSADVCKDLMPLCPLNGERSGHLHFRSQGSAPGAWKISSRLSSWTLGGKPRPPCHPDRLLGPPLLPPKTPIPGHSAPLRADIPNLSPDVLESAFTGPIMAKTKSLLAPCRLPTTESPPGPGGEAQPVPPQPCPPRSLPELWVCLHNALGGWRGPSKHSKGCSTNKLNLCLFLLQIINDSTSYLWEYEGRGQVPPLGL